MVKKTLTFLTIVLLAFGMAGCTASGTDTSSAQEGLQQDLEPNRIEEQTVMCSIRITAGDTVLEGVLYDNPTAQGFAEMLPFTVELWHPAPDFARAFDLPDHIAEKGMPGYEYELGSLAYWDAGPSIALIYKASREETVVPVVPVGKITSDVSVFEEYAESITIEMVEDMKEVSDPDDIAAGNPAVTAGSSGTTENGGVAEGGEAVFTADTRVWDVINDPAFGDYGRLIFPADKSISDSLTLGDVGNILTWYSYVSPDRTVEIANYLKEHAVSGEQIFYDIYTEEEKAADPAKEDTGLFFFRGTPGEKFAVTIKALTSPPTDKSLYLSNHHIYRRLPAVPFTGFTDVCGRRFALRFSSPSSPVSPPLPAPRPCRQPALREEALLPARQSQGEYFPYPTCRCRKPCQTQSESAPPKRDKYFSIAPA